MRLTGAPIRPSSSILRTIARDTAIRWSIFGVRRRTTARSSSERTRLEWTVDTTIGRRPVGGEPPRGLRPDDLGPVHVVVDDVGPRGPKMRGDRLGRGLVVGLVDDADREARPLEAADRAPVGEADERDV